MPLTPEKVLSQQHRHARILLKAQKAEIRVLHNTRLEMKIRLARLRLLEEKVKGKRLEKIQKQISELTPEIEKIDKEYKNRLFS